MTKQKSKEEKTKKEISEKWGTVLLVLVIIMPIIQAAVIGLYQVLLKSADPLPGICWNDEAVYLKLIENYAKYFSPKGYWGFDACHAILGSGPAWSPATIWPYALIAKIFPVGPHFVFFCNLFFMTLGIGIFCLFTRPDKDARINLLGFELLSLPVVLYLNTNMSELYRYALAIVLAGMLYYMYTDTGKAKPALKYALIPLTLLYAVQVYIFFAFAIPLYVSALLKKKRIHVRFLISLPVTAVVTLGSYYFLHLISSNYNIGKTEGLLNAVSAGDFPGAVKSFLFMVKEGLSGVWYLKNYVTGMPLYPYSVIFAISLVVVGLFLAIWGKNIPEKWEDVHIGRMVAHSVAIFYAMYITLYTIVPDTFYRGTQIVVIFSLYLIAMCKREYLVRFFLLFSLMGMFLAKPQFSAFMDHHYETSRAAGEWKALRSDLEEVVSVDKNAGLWDNTVLMYTMEPKAISAIPVGLSENFVLTEGTFSGEPKYLFFSKANPEDTDPGWIVQSYENIYEANREIIDGNYTVIYDTDSYIMYRKGQ